MNQKKLSFISSLCLILTAAIWGFAFVIVKDSLDYVGSVWMIAFRFTIAAILLGLCFLKKFKLMTRKLFFQGAFLGLLLFLAYVVQTIGCFYTTAGKNAFLTAVYVVFIPIIMWPLTGKRPRWYVFLAACMCLGGIGILSLKTGDTGGVNIGDILTLICGVFYALHIIFVARTGQDGDPILLTILQFAFAALFGWILSVFIQNPEVNGPFPLEQLKNYRVILSMLYLGVFSTCLAFLMQNVCLKFVAPPLASLFLSLEAVFGVLFSSLILHEALSIRMISGCLLIFAAILLAEVLPGIENSGKRKSGT